jgi:hypothetical protein
MDGQSQSSKNEQKKLVIKLRKKKQGTPSEYGK